MQPVPPPVAQKRILSSEPGSEEQPEAESWRQMNGLLWIAQLILAAVFFTAALGKLFAYEKVMHVVESAKGKPVTLSRREAILVALAEIAGAIAIMIPDRVAPPHFFVLCAATWLGFLMVGAAIYHVRRKESAAPNIAILLLALFVLVGRWPR